VGAVCFAGDKKRIAVKVMSLTHGSIRSTGRAELKSIIQYPASISETITKKIPKHFFRMQILFSLYLHSAALEKRRFSFIQ
jgi:hypothetical protein